MVATPACGAIPRRRRGHRGMRVIESRISGAMPPFGIAPALRKRRRLGPSRCGTSVDCLVPLESFGVRQSI
jgi:hypothetical protein